MEWKCWKVLSYFGIDASKDFTVNGAKYTKEGSRIVKQYEILQTTNPLIGQEKKTASEDSGLQVWFGDKSLEEWAVTEPKYTDKETGFSWYVRDGKYPYMTGEDATKFMEMCEETGEPSMFSVG